MSSIKEKSFLSDEDWKILLPIKQIPLGNSSITIQPLNITDFSFLTSKIIHTVKRIQKMGNFSDIFKDEKLFSKMITIIIAESPEIITSLTGLPITDIKRLPFAKSLELTITAWELNMVDQESLTKNLGGVATMIQQMTGMILGEETTQDLEIPSSS